VEQVWPRGHYGRRGLNTPFENILRLCMELYQPGYIEAWFIEHQDCYSMKYVMTMITSQVQHGPNHEYVQLFPDMVT